MFNARDSQLAMRDEHRRVSNQASTTAWCAKIEISFVYIFIYTYIKMLIIVKKNVTFQQKMLLFHIRIDHRH